MARPRREPKPGGRCAGRADMLKGLPERKSLLTFFLHTASLRSMRLSSHQCEKIREIVERIAGTGAGIFVFGSRVDDDRRGGDVDLFIETSGPLDLLLASRITTRLEASLQLPFDVVAVRRGSVLTPFQTMARSRASLLP